MKKCVPGLALCVALSAAATAQDIAFEDVTAAAGISYVGQSWGGAWGDFDGDGYYDLWSPNHGSVPSLLVNQQDGTFVDLAQQALPADVWTYYLTTLGSYDMHGSVWFDFDNDGDLDLFQAADGGVRMQPNHLYINDGGNAFSAEIGQAAGVALPSFNSTMPLAFDRNQDGLTDIYLANNPRLTGVSPVAVFQRNSITPDFSDVTAELGLPIAEDNKFARVTDLDRDETLELLSGPTPATLGVFELDGPMPSDITAILGLGADSGMVDAVVADFDGDLDDDIYAVRGESTLGLVQVDDLTVEASVQVNGHERGFSFRTTGNVTVSFFPTNQTPVSKIFIGSTGYAPPATSFTLDPDDVANHGIVSHTPGTTYGHYVGYEPSTQTWTVLLSNSVYALRTMVVTSDQVVSEVQPIGFFVGQFTPSDRYYHNDGGVFVQEAASRGFATPSSGRNIGAGDFDNDGDVDLYVVSSGAVENNPNLLYVNDGTGHFSALVDGGGAAGGSEGRGDAVAVADYDNDGFLDLFVTNGKDRVPFFEDGPYYLFRNLGNANRWLEIELVGTVSESSGTGVSAHLLAGGQSQRRMQGGGVHYRAQDMRRLHFGVAGNDVIDRVDIFWPSGRLQRFEAVASNQILIVTEPLTQEDGDGDGVLDELDNCAGLANPLQVDADSDGYGNRCDADFNNDCVTNTIDLGQFKAGFFGTDSLLDLDGDGVVNSVDLGIMKALYFLPPGPSGTSLLCAP